MKFLVTGGLGFIGSNFIKKLFETDSECFVQNIDAGFNGSNEKNVDEIKDNKNYKFVKGDICDYDLMHKLISDSDIIVNFAAESFVDKSIANTKPFLDSNIIGVHNILEILKKERKKLIHISTDEVFGSLENSSANEMFRFNPSSPYASSKACAELLINSYNITFDLDCVITRCTNNYGPKQFPEKLIPKIIFSILKKKPIPIYAKGLNSREWIFVEDHCRALEILSRKGKIGQSYNIGSNQNLSNLQITNLILEIIKKNFTKIKINSKIIFVKDRPGHDLKYAINSNKIRKELKWKPIYNIHDGLKKTINWYIENPKYFTELNKKDYIKRLGLKR